MLTCAHPPALPPLDAYWELGERARARLASKIAPCSTRCLRAQPSGGRGKKPCNVTRWCQKKPGHVGSKGPAARTDSDTLKRPQRSRSGRLLSAAFVFLDTLLSHAGKMFFAFLLEYTSQSLCNSTSEKGHHVQAGNHGKDVISGSHLTEVTIMQHTLYSQQQCNMYTCVCVSKQAT